MSINKAVKFNPFDYPICLDDPQRLTDIDFWHEHIPFAFTLIQMLEPRIFVELGTHKGDSYCAFCQAVAKLKTQTRCYAVDTWEGDEHVGHYEQSIYDELKEYHDPRYGSFSTLLRSLFDDALLGFADKSIDLLHIDGLHTYDAVKHDFDTWLPKISDRGVVLFHDTNVREEAFAERGYEVWRFFEEVSKLYPSYEFKYGNGLGVLAVGNQIPEPLEPLLGEDKAQAELIGKMYFALGNRVHDISKAKKKHKEQANIKEYLESTLQDRDQLKQDRDALHRYLDTVEQDRQKLREHLNEVEQDRQKLREHLNEVEQDRKISRESLGTIEKERKNLLEYLDAVEKDRKNLLEYLDAVEKDRQELKAQYDITSKALTSLENTKILRLNRTLQSQIFKLQGRLRKNKP